ncbi:uncharacterized protein PHACADRAFT_106910, partial [Phanerochaete carnosa HHB-10118-sp]
KHVVLDVGTGGGKTLAFYLPALFAASGQLMIVVIALNVLAAQNIAHKYTIVIASPEQIVKWGRGFERLFKDLSFHARILCVVFDEGHCISQWGAFGPEYSEISRLRYLLPESKFIFASATFSPLILDDIKKLFGLA